jgi:ketosteroid isomerase-like protein
MKKQFILICVALIGLAPICFGQTKASSSNKPAAKETAVIDLEKSAWEAYENKQADAFKRLMAKDYSGAYAEGIKTLDNEVADMEKGDLRQYSFADTKVVLPNADVAVMTYKVTTQGTSAGQDMSGTYNAASVWVKREGKWLGAFHTEVKAQ